MSVPGHALVCVCVCARARPPGYGPGKGGWGSVRVVGEHAERKIRPQLAVTWTGCAPMPAGTSGFWVCWSGRVHGLERSSTSTKQQWGPPLRTLASCGMRASLANSHTGSSRSSEERLTSLRQTSRIEQALAAVGLETIHARRERQAHASYQKMWDPRHKRHHLLPEARQLT